MSEATAQMREKLFTMRMSTDEAERLDAVSKKYGLNAAGLLRMLVKREFDALDDPTPGVKAIQNKAVERWQRDCEAGGHVYQQPSGDVEIEGARVTLRNARGVLARYTYKVDGGGRIRFTPVEKK
jgi:hypothetical protein